MASLSGVTLPALGQSWAAWATAVDGTIRTLEAVTSTTENMVALTADVTNSTTTGIAVTGLEIPAGLAVGVYALDATFLLTSADVGTGIQMAIASTTGVTPSVQWLLPQGTFSVATQYDRVGNTYDAPTTAAYSGGDPLPGFCRGALIVTAATTTPIQFLIKSEVAGSQVAVKVGSHVKWRRVSTNIPVASGGTGGGGGSTTPTNPTGTLIFQDGFLGTDGAAWGSNWMLGYTGTLGAAATINQNRGMLKTGATGNYATTDKIARLYTAQLANFHALYSFQFDTTATEIYLDQMFRNNINFEGDIQNGYILRIQLDALILIRSTGYTGTDLAATVRTHTQGTKWWCRVKAIGSTLQARTWANGTTEPTTWDISVTDATYTAAGYWGFTVGGSGEAKSQIAYVDDLYVAQS